MRVPRMYGNSAQIARQKPHAGLPRVYLRLHLPLDPMHRAGAESDHLGNLQDTGALAQMALRLAFKLAGDRRPAQMLALSDCALETELYPLLDHAALELGKGPG